MRLKTFGLLILIVIFGVFIYITSAVRGDENSHFNQTTRYKLGRFGWARALFFLHKDGDAKAQYLFGSGPLVLEIVRAEDVEINQELTESLASSTQQLLERPVQVFSVDTIKGGQLTDADIQTIVKEKHRHFLPGQPNFFVIVADDYEGRDKEVGKTYQEFAALLSYERLKEVTDRYPASLNQYLESTILHEFGHQVGLSHNDLHKCIMNEKIESPDSEGLFEDYFTPVEFCEFEIDQLKEIKASLN
jgi:predicted Zn-dependent protease